MRQEAVISTACNMTIIDDERAALYHKMDAVACTGDVESVSVCAICTSIMHFNNTVLNSIKVTGGSQIMYRKVD